jgi:(S)-sulfolactate dehydrogenase
MATVVISEWIDERAVARLAERHTVVSDPRLFADPGALHAALAGAEAWVVRNQTRVDAAALVHAPRLRVVGRVGVGLDNLDLDALRTAGVAVTWAPGTNAASVAEYVLGALLHLWRRFDAATDHVRGGGWDRPAFMGHEAFGRTLGVVGLGDIGARVARRAAAFGLRVVATDPVLHDASFAVQEYGVQLLPLAELLAVSDAVTLHVPLVPATRGLIDAAAMERMRPGALLVNTSRGGLVDEAALADALRGGVIAGAAADAFDREPPTGSPLLALPTFVPTPHLGAATREAARRMGEAAARNVVAVLTGVGEADVVAAPPRRPA